MRTAGTSVNGASPTKIFVNLPVKDLKRSMAFFTKLGYTFDPQFTNENGACMRIGENIFSMLVTETFFQTFTPKRIVDAKASSETIVALAVEDRAKVDELVAKAIKASGAEPRETQDLGWMYSRAFEDLDGHIWEPFFMDMAAMKAAQTKS